MHCLLLLTILAATVSFSIAAPAATHTVQTFSGEKTGRLIVKLKPGVARTNVLALVGKNATITHEWDLINGFAGNFDDDALNALQVHPDVLSIAEDGMVYTQITQ